MHFTEAFAGSFPDAVTRVESASRRVPTVMLADVKRSARVDDVFPDVPLPPEGPPLPPCVVVVVVVAVVVVPDFGVVVVVAVVVVGGGADVVVGGGAVVVVGGGGEPESST